MSISQNALVSIVIPVYNRENLIRETIASAIAQTYQHIEIIIVDNNSTDSTWKILQDLVKQDRRLNIYRNEENIGPVRNWRRCIDYASGEFVKILWSDDLIDPLFVESAINFFREDDNVGFVYSKAKIFKYRDQVSKNDNIIFDLNRRSCILNSSFFLDGIFSNETFSGKFPYSPGCALFRTEAVRQNLLIQIPTKFKIDFAKEAIGNDLYIFLLTAKMYSKFGYLDQVYSFFREHQDSISTISSDRLDLIYTITKSSFLNDHLSIFHISVIKKFNSILKVVFKNNKSNSYGINRPGDLSNTFKYKYNYFFYIRLSIRKKLKGIIYILANAKKKIMK